MGVIDECGVLVDELRDDPAFVDALCSLRGRLIEALAASHPKDRKMRYAKVATALQDIFRRLEAQR